MCVHGVEWGGCMLSQMCGCQRTTTWIWLFPFNFMWVSVCWGTCCRSWPPGLCSKCLNTLSHFHGHNSIIFILKDMPILSVIFMNWISFLLLVAIPTGGRNFISTSVCLVWPFSLLPAQRSTQVLISGVAFAFPELMGASSAPCCSMGLPGFPYSHLSPLRSLRQPCFPQPPCHYLNNSHFKGKQQFSCALVNHPRFSSCWAKKFINTLSKCLWHFATLSSSFFWTPRPLCRFYFSFPTAAIRYNAPFFIHAVIWP